MKFLGSLGIQRRYVKMLDKEEYVANYARAIADLVYKGETAGLKNCVQDYLDDNEESELFNYLKLINKNKKVDDFMKFELTKLYFKDKRMLEQYQKDRVKLIKRKFCHILGNTFVLKVERHLVYIMG